MNVTKPQNIRFGWVAQTHKAIIEGAIEQLPRQGCDSLKTFLKAEEHEIWSHDTFEDVDNSGTHHFSDPGDINNNHSDLRNVPALKLLKNAMGYFCPVNRPKIEMMLRHLKLPKTLHVPEKSIFDALRTSLSGVERRLRVIKEGYPRLETILDSPSLPMEAEDQEVLREMPKHKLSELLGRQTHYSGDLTSPPHGASRFGDMPLLPQNYSGDQKLKFSEGLHLFCEKDVLTAEDLEDCVAQAKQSGGIVPDSEGVDVRNLSQEEFLEMKALPVFKETHLAMYDVVQAHQNWLKKSSDGNLNLEDLKTALRPILKRQVMRAQKFLAQSLYYVYRRADSPDLQHLT